jgi:hypothetical protein
MKEAFTAPALERSALDANRETPIDRWMGWNVKSEDSKSSLSKGAFGCRLFVFVYRLFVSLHPLFVLFSCT